MTVHQKATRAGQLKAVCGGIALALASATMAPAAADLQAGTLVCKGDGGWGAIITSKKSFDCTFSSSDGVTVSKYTGVIRKFGLDLGVTGDTTLTWLVMGPADRVGANFAPGALAGKYAGAGVEATAGVGLGANALIGGGDESFALQPFSVQVQTGISIAAAVQTLTLEYVGPLQ